MCPIPLSIYIIDNNVLIYGNLVPKSWNLFKCIQVNKSGVRGKVHSLGAACSEEVISQRQEKERKRKKYHQKTKITKLEPRESSLLVGKMLPGVAEC